jgi:hypothetical protein
MNDRNEVKLKYARIKYEIEQRYHAIGIEFNRRCILLSKRLSTLISLWRTPKIFAREAMYSKKVVARYQWASKSGA